MKTIALVIVFLTILLSKPAKREPVVLQEYIITQSGDTAYAVYDTVVHKKYVIR